MVKVNLNQVELAKDFVSTMSKLDDVDVFLKHDTYVVNGKSILGVLSLDLSKEVEVEIIAKTPNLNAVNNAYQLCKAFA